MSTSAWMADGALLTVDTIELEGNPPDGRAVDRPEHALRAMLMHANGTMRARWVRLPETVFDTPKVLARPDGQGAVIDVRGGNVPQPALAPISNFWVPYRILYTHRGWPATDADFLACFTPGHLIGEATARARPVLPIFPQ